MPSICFYFQVHQPWRLKRFRVFDIGNKLDYFDDRSETNLNNGRILRKVAEKSYRPANQAILGLLKRYPEFRVSYSFSGTVLDQLAEYAPEVLDSFRELIDTGRAEVLGETYYHSLSFFYSPGEFARQVALHREKVEEIFGVKPKVFRNTELAYNNELAKWADQAGYSGIVAEGWDPILGWRSPNFIYRPRETKKIGLLLKNYRLADDMAFRFSEKTWREWPLSADKFARWISALNGDGQVVNLFMDYETFGEHQWESTGIFNFLNHLPGAVYEHPDNNFLTLSEALAKYKPVGEVDVPGVVTWADTERDLSAWLGNKLQTETIERIYALEPVVMKLGDEKILEDWRRLQTSDHFYYMCTKWFADGDVHAYFNPYSSPYDAFISYTNALQDFELRLGVK